MIDARDHDHTNHDIAGKEFADLSAHAGIRKPGEHHGVDFRWDIDIETIVGAFSISIYQMHRRILWFITARNSCMLLQGLKSVAMTSIRP